MLVMGAEENPWLYSASIGTIILCTYCGLSEQTSPPGFVEWANKRVCMQAHVLQVFPEKTTSSWTSRPVYDAYRSCLLQPLSGSVRQASVLMAFMIRVFYVMRIWVFVIVLKDTLCMLQAAFVSSFHV